MSRQAALPIAAGAAALRPRLARAAATTAGLTAAGSALGLVRDQTIARLFGAGAESDAFLVAWTLPEIAATVLIEDAMALVMVPAFSGVLARNDDVRELMRATLPRLLTVLAVLTTTLAACAPYVVTLLAPGLPDPATAITCTRLTALTLFTFGLTGYLSAALRAHGHYLPPAVVYVAYNAGILITLLVLHDLLGVRAAATGVAVGGTLMIAVQLPAAAKVLRTHPRRPPGARGGAARPRGPVPQDSPRPAATGSGVGLTARATHHGERSAPAGDLRHPAPHNHEPRPTDAATNLPTRAAACGERPDSAPDLMIRTTGRHERPAPSKALQAPLPRTAPAADPTHPAAPHDERPTPAQRPPATEDLPVPVTACHERPAPAGDLRQPAASALRAALPGWERALAPVVVFTLGRQAQVLVERFFAAGLPTGAISHLNYAQKVAQVPMVLSLMVCTVTFPVVSRDLAAGEWGRARKRVERDLTLACAVVLVGSAYVVACAPQVVQVLFQRGEFDAGDTVATAGVMRVYALGLLGQSVVGALVRPYFSAGGPGWGPAGAMGVGLGVTAAVDAGAVGGLGVYGIAAGNAAGITVTAALLLRGLGARGIALRVRVLAPRLGVLVLAAAAATGAGWALAARVPGASAAAGAGMLAVFGVFVGVVAVAAALPGPRGSESARHRRPEVRP